MAKNEMHSQIVRFAEVQWFVRLNGARPTGWYGSDNELKDLRTRLAREAWWKDANGVVEVDSLDAKWCEGYAKEAMELREKQLQALTEQVKEDPSKALKLQVWKKLFCDDKGKIIKPKYIGITANRRASQYFESCVERMTLKDDEGNLLKLDWDDTIPVTVKDYSDEKIRLKAQVRENEGKTMSFLPSSPVDQLMFAGKLKSHGHTQSDLRNMFSSPSVGVKYDLLWKLNSTYPNLKIIERCQIVSPSNEEGAGLSEDELKDWIPIKRVDHSILQSFVQRETPASTSKYNEKRAKKAQPPVGVLTEEELDKYLRGLANGVKPEADRMMDKNTVQSMKEGQQNPLIVDCLTGVRQNNAENIKKLDVFAVSCQAIYKLEREGDLPNAEKILVALASAKKGVERNEMENKILKVLGIK